MVQFKQQDGILITFQENNTFLKTEKNKYVENIHSKLETPKKNQEIQ